MNSSSTTGAAVQAQTESHEHGNGHLAGEVFTYLPLNFTSSSRKTRFLKLLPATNLKDEIRCTIYHSSLDDFPVYEALSYAWGGEVADDPQPIFLSYEQDDSGSMVLETSGERKEQANLGSEGRFQITPSLDAALRHIRLSTSSRTVWTDAICINQKDEAEKAHQIGYMRNIYLEAQRVVAWLGEEKDAMEALKFLGSISWVAPDCSNYIFDEKDTPKWKACDDLFGREYWKRSWILQEVLHHKEVIFHLGIKTISIDDMSANFDKYFFTKLNLASERDSMALNKYKSKDLSELGNWRYDGWFRATATSESAPDTLFTMREQLKNPDAEAPRLSKLLHMYRDQQATHARDKIYSMLCMAKAEYTIPIDYRTREEGGFSTGDIYTITTRQMLTRVLMVLLWVESPDRNIASNLDNGTLPSWVPDYTTKQPLTTRTMHTTYDYFSADKGFPGGLSSKNTDPSLPNNHPLFVVRGIYVACITNTHYTYVIGNWIVKDDFKDFHLLKLIQYDRNPSLRIGTVEGKGGFLPQTSNGKPTLDISFENTSWGPCKAEVGDIIIVAAGCKIPIVLRKHGEQYLLVGGCWLVDKKIKNLRNLQERDDAFSGLMYGDAVKEVETSSIIVEEFILC
ncbi:heterokaryon incompatibility protein-domain-containing protein [Rhexocercosporidium sp. MPI-PUGE-AT-0058]|nr:heterokaryon incompatibility protein-domain-containing protein [Rhexocercosporidium sp. MPI-PUGE-AT-0058]